MGVIIITNKLLLGLNEIIHGVFRMLIVTSLHSMLVVIIYVNYLPLLLSFSITCIQ